MQADGSQRLLRSYAWGLDMGGGIGGLLSLSVWNGSGQIASTYLPLYDGGGNICGLADAASGQVVASYEYDPFGNLLSQSGDAAALAANPFLFSSKYLDRQSGLYYFGLRYYLPEQGRFLTRDPLGEGGGVNLYAYCGNDPVNRIDPLGAADRTSVRVTGEGATDNGQWQWKMYSDGRTVMYNMAHNRIEQWFRDDAGNQVQLSYRSETRSWGHTVENDRTIMYYSRAADGKQEWKKVLAPSPALVAWAKTVVPEFRYRMNTYFDAATAQQIEDELRHANLLQVAETTANVLDTVIRFVPGSGVLLDLPEVATGNSSTMPGRTVSGTSRVVTGTVMVGGAVLLALKCARLAAHADDIGSASRVAGLGHAADKSEDVLATIKFKHIEFGDIHTISAGIGTHIRFTVRACKRIT